jgi:hypothetical protein
LTHRAFAAISAPECAPVHLARFLRLKTLFKAARRIDPRHDDPRLQDFWAFPAAPMERDTRDRAFDAPG